MNKFTGMPSPPGLMGAGKMYSVKESVKNTPGIIDVTTCTDTSEHTEKPIALCSTGVFLGHAGHEEGG